MGVVVYLGNHNTIDKVYATDAEGQPIWDPAASDWAHERVPVAGKNRMEYAPPESWSVAEIVADITHVWSATHSDDPAPKWVAATDPSLATVLGAVWGCEVRDVDLNHEPSGV